MVAIEDDPLEVGKQVALGARLWTPLGCKYKYKSRCM